MRTTRQIRYDHRYLEYMGMSRKQLRDAAARIFDSRMPDKQARIDFIQQELSLLEARGA